MSDRIYYKVWANSPVMAVIQQAEAIIRRFRKAMDALEAEFAAEYPGSSVWVWNYCQFVGITFPGKLPPGWRQGREYAVPDMRIKAGRALAARLKDLPKGIEARKFSAMLSSALGEAYTAWNVDDRCTVMWTVYEHWGKNGYILSVPAACRVTPPGCRELKMSEYWKIREKHTDAKEKAGIKAR